MDGPDGPGGPPGQYNIATSFVDQGSIDGLTIGICDGNFKYNVTTSGIIEYAKKNNCREGVFPWIKNNEIYQNWCVHTFNILVNLSIILAKVYRKVNFSKE